jgi:hypothetical protein
VNCSKCGQDVGTEGVVTVEITTDAEGKKQAVYYRECRQCAQAEARKESQSEQSLHGQ